MQCPYGGDWSGAKVSRWVLEHLGVELKPKTGIDYLHRLKLSQQVPRPKNQRADEEAQEAFKKGGLSPR
jgi:transposase